VKGGHLIKLEKNLKYLGVMLDQHHPNAADLPEILCGPKFELLPVNHEETRFPTLCGGGILTVLQAGGNHPDPEEGREASQAGCRKR